MMIFLSSMRVQKKTIEVQEETFMKVRLKADNFMSARSTQRT